MTDYEMMLSPGGIIPVNIETTGWLVREVLRLRQLQGPLAELIVAYQDADSPAIQDAIRRGRLALSNGARGGAT